MQMTFLFLSAVATAFRICLSIPRNAGLGPSAWRNPAAHSLCPHRPRGILLKGNGIGSIAPQLWPITLFVVIAMFIAVKRYRQTLD
jgi:hypothetical protein